MIKLAKYDLEGHLLEIIEGDNLNVLALQENIEYTSLRRAVKNISLVVNNLQYKQVDANYSTPIKIGEVWKYTTGKYKTRNTLIGKYYKGKLISTYNNLAELSEKNNFQNVTSISRGLKMNKNIKKGIFEFKNVI